MSDIQYGMVKRLSGVSFTLALEKTREALKTQGFGVLTEIDVKETLKKKLGEDFRPYAILGACNPPLAFQALKGEEHIGLLLPCNVVVMADGEDSVVSVVDPEAMFSVVGRSDLAALAAEVKGKLQAVLDVL